MLLLTLNRSTSEASRASRPPSTCGPTTAPLSSRPLTTRISFESKYKRTWFSFPITVTNAARTLFWSRICASHDADGLWQGSSMMGETRRLPPRFPGIYFSPMTLLRLFLFLKKKKKKAKPAPAPPPPTHQMTLFGGFYSAHDQDDDHLVR